MAGIHVVHRIAGKLEGKRDVVMQGMAEAARGGVLAQDVQADPAHMLQGQPEFSGSGHYAVPSVFLSR